MDGRMDPNPREGAHVAQARPLAAPAHQGVAHHGVHAQQVVHGPIQQRLMPGHQLLFLHPGLPHAARFGFGILNSRLGQHYFSMGMHDQG